MPEIASTKSPLITNGPAEATPISIVELLNALYVAGWSGSKRYVVTRRAGATHTQALEVCFMGIDEGRYALLKRDATHEEALEACQKDVNVHWYGFVRLAGDSHAEAMEAWEKITDPFRLRTYPEVRKVTGSHALAFDVCCMDISIDGYIWLRRRGDTHAEAIEAFRRLDDED